MKKQCTISCLIAFLGVIYLYQKKKSFSYQQILPLQEWHNKRSNMQNIRSSYTDSINFFGKTSPEELIKTYGSPLYVYNESILRQRCKEIKSLSSYPNFFVSYSAKANTNPILLSIIKDEGCLVDAMSPGEVYLHKKVGFKPDEILYVCNNISAEEIQYTIDNKILLSIDSLSQLETYGKLNPGGKIMVRINPGIGTGHHKKVITGGKETKFGINIEQFSDVKKIVDMYQLMLVGINQHIGSLFLDPQNYLDSIDFLLQFIDNNPWIFEQLEIIDFGGGFGIPYKKYEEQPRLDLKKMSEQFNTKIMDWITSAGYKGRFYIEPGRYLIAESGILLGSVYAVKYNGPIRYIGTDVGFNVLMRPVLYDAYHDIEVYRKNGTPDLQLIPQTVVGNICESGDIIANKRPLPLIQEGDIIGILDVGAYGFVMSSNYNQRPRPAEILIQENGEPKLIRKRETIEDMNIQLH